MARVMLYKATGLKEVLFKGYTDSNGDVTQATLYKLGGKYWVADNSLKQNVEGDLVLLDGGEWQGEETFNGKTELDEGTTVYVNAVKDGIATFDRTGTAVAIGNVLSIEDDEVIISFEHEGFSKDDKVCIADDGSLVSDAGVEIGEVTEEGEMTVKTGVTIAEGTETEAKAGNVLYKDSVGLTTISDGAEAVGIITEVTDVVYFKLEDIDES